MKRSMKKMAIGLLSVAFSASLLCAALFQSGNVTGLADATMQIALQEEYTLGVNFEIPKEMELTDNETSETATNGRLIFPDGKNYSCGQSVDLMQQGEYTLIYQSENFISERKFTVLAQNWSVTSSRSTVAFGDLSYSNYTNSSGSKGSKADEQGLLLNLAEGDVFRYNVPINVYNYEMIDVIQAYPKMWTTNQRTCYASFVTVKLVDYYNADNFVEFYMWCDSSGNSGTYLGAGASNQSMVGMETITSDQSTSSKAIYFEEQWYKRHPVQRYNAKQQYGASAKCGKSNELMFYQGGLNFQFDPIENRAYTSLNYYYESDDARKTLESRFLNDLDSPEIYTNYSENVFGGFTTGEVYLELQCQMYTSEANSSLEIQIESLFGLTGDALKQSTYNDETAPTISVDAMNGIEKFNVVKGKEINIPEASVYDVNYYGAAKASVYFNYQSSERILVYAKDGKFTAKENGDYTIVYSARDSFGNYAEKTITVFAIDGILFDYAKTELTDLVAGREVALPTVAVRGINGDVHTDVRIYDPKGNTVAVTDGTFIPTVVGTYSVEYTFYDNFAEEVWSYEIDCKDEGIVQVFDAVSLPTAFVKGATYVIEDYNVYTFSANGVVANKTAVYYAKNSGEFTPLSENMQKAFVVDDGDSFTFDYRYENRSIVQKEVPVVDVNLSGKKDLAKYFLGNYVSATASNKNVTYAFDGTQSGELSFINTLPFETFLLEYSIPAGYGKFTSLKIVLSDYLNANESVTVEYREKDGGVEICVGEESALIKEAKLDGTGFEIWYEKKSNCFTTDGGLHIPSPSLSGYFCTMKVVLDGVYGECAIAVEQINNQAFTTRAKEAVPEFSVEYPNGLFEQNAYYTIEVPKISSVLYPVYVDASVVSVTVTNPVKQVINDTNGVTLQNVDGSSSYVISLTDVGLYKVSYTVKVAGTTLPIPYTIKVVDTAEPVVKFEKGIDENTLIKVKIGVAHTFKSFTVTDNVTATKDLFTLVFVYDAGHRIEAYGKNLSSFTFYKKGYYTVCVMSKDSQGNLGKAYYNVLAE